MASFGGVYIQRTSAASCCDRMMSIYVKQGKVRTFPSPFATSTTHPTYHSREVCTLRTPEESLSSSTDIFLRRPPYFSRPVASTGGSSLSKMERKTVAPSLPAVSQSLSSPTCEGASRSSSFVSASLPRRETSSPLLPFYTEPSLHESRQYHMRRSYSSAVRATQYVKQLSHGHYSGVYTPDIRGFSFLRRSQGHMNFGPFYTRNFTSSSAPSSSSSSGRSISKEERNDPNEKENKDKKNTSSHSPRVWSSLFLFSLLGLVAGWHGQRIFQAFHDGYTSNSVVRVKCIDTLGDDETEELVRNEFSSKLFTRRTPTLRPLMLLRFIRI
ncbi:hypothetical protein CSUI_004057 [Cystoisospora suis]|uniref:Uncharacterized protein n=1 Tax=Cystoisospora suis TaxID=483139 RepID=A0A2C6KYK9_9APIC|nr:hypothetical protein CSUI_004057 [Cystoisospora suis]